jgi:hypothetical protein
VCPVHGGVSTPSEQCVDDIAREVIADRKHVPSVGRTTG